MKAFFVSAYSRHTIVLAGMSTTFLARVEIITARMMEGLTRRREGTCLVHCEHGTSQDPVRYVVNTAMYGNLVGTW